MPAMSSATPTIFRCSRGRTWLLAWLVSGVFASAAYAQTDAGAATTVAQPPADTGVDRVVPAQENAAPELVAAEPVDPVKAGEQLLKSNIAEYGARSLQVAEAHLDLANAQREKKDYDKAAESYLAAVEAYRSVDRKSTRLNSSHLGISYAVFCLKK